MNPSEPLSPIKRAIVEIRELKAQLERVQREAAEPIAIIGLGCRFPGADGPQAFWQLLKDGVDAIREVPRDRWDVDALFDADPEARGKVYTRHGGYLDRVDEFDAGFFGISPREATSLDPQQRLMLEVTWEALEHAGQAADQLLGSSTGVFVGICSNEYGSLQLSNDRAGDLDAYYGTGNALSVAAGRLSYFFGWRGPSVALDTACSSSLVAVHLACQSLRHSECRMAVAGGVNLLLRPESTINFCRARMLAPDGRCKTFDASADGYSRAEGAGVVVLKRLSHAIEDGDRVLAVVLGSAVNQDGRSSGLTVPNGPSQEAVIRDAIARARIEPGDVSFIEAHGTGTSLGDPIEVHALRAVFGGNRAASSPLVIGSAKTNVGHLEAAAGIAGLAKVVLSMQHGEIPRHLHFRQLNPHIDLAGAAIEVAGEGRPWSPPGRRVAGVSSFGFSGTNAHVIVAEAPARAAATVLPDRTSHILTLSAKTHRALVALAERWRDHLAQTEHSVADVCFTANAGRAHFAHRAAMVARSVDELTQGLATIVARHEATQVWQGEVAPGTTADVAFVFPAVLSTSTSFAVLRDEQPAFRAALERCSAIAEARTGRGITDSELDNAQANPDARRSVITWALQVALAEMWLSWGVCPRFVTGNGPGAVVAAQIAGAISEQEAFELAVGNAVTPTNIGEMRYAMVRSGGLVSPRDLQSEAFWRRSDADAEQAMHTISAHGVGLVLLFGAEHPVPDALAGGTFTAIAADTAPETQALAILAQLYVRGGKVAWERFDSPFNRSRVALPTYPFQRQRHWSDFIKPAGASATGREVGERSAWIHDVVWRPDASRPRSPSALQRLSIVADHGGVADAVAHKLRESNVEATVLRRGDSVETQGGDAILVLHGLDLAAHDGSTGSMLQAAIVSACDRFVGIVRDIATRPDNASPRLLTVSRGAYAVSKDDPVAVAQAPIAALAAVVNAEHPDLSCASIDLDPSADVNAAADAIVSELLLGGRRETRVAWRAGNRFVARLVPAAPSWRTPISVRSDATYLITGGAGALGLHVTAALVDSGARHLVLVGRRAVNDAITAALQAWTERGCSVRYISGDIGTDDFVEGVLTTIGATLPPLAGICHTAGVLDDGVLLQQNAERFSRVMTPKVAGAWNLHRAVGAAPLDFFVMFSSLASIFGTAGQSNYAAANAFLDALACERRRQGLAATSIAWGPWNESGMAAAAGGTSQRRWASQGLGRIDVASGVALFRELSGRDGPPTPVVAPIDWRAYLAARAADVRPAWLDEIVAEAGDATVAAAAVDSELATKLQALPPEEQHATLVGLARENVARVLGLPSDERIDPRQGLLDLGIDSLMALELRNVIQRAVGQTLPATFTFDHPTLEAMATYLRGLLVTAAPEQPAPSVAAPPAGVAVAIEPIAIVGLGCRMPGGIDSPEAFWQLLHDGGDAITAIPASRWNADDYYDPDPKAPGKMVTRRGGFVRDAELFDPQFFGIAPREATTMDPQQRLLLEVAWEALEHAGLPPDRLHGSRTGVFVGISTNEYVQLQLRRTDVSKLEGHVGTGGATSVAAGRLSYSLGLQGPAMAVDTACSSSLVAVHLACQSLRQRECETALAGGVNMILAPEGNVILSRARMLSPEGRCKTFDAAADGYVRSEGCGVVVLKRLRDAVASGDRVLAVIRGTAVNQDGRSGGLTVPNGPAQESLIRDALRAADLQPVDIDYIEAHGTGTSLGDPIEVRALGNVFAGGRARSRPLVIGSVKTNVGHLEPAAGVAGLIKVVLSLHHGEIPPHLHLTSVNPLIALDAIPAVIPTTATPWSRGDRPRRAGVSSFGFSGTNAHAVIEEAPLASPATSAVRTHHVLTLSAKTPAALREVAARYVEQLDRTTDSLSDIAFTANTGRTHFAHRLAVTGTTSAEVSAALRSRAPAIADEDPAGPRKIAFLFTGQGAQYPAMARELYTSEATFRGALDRCAGLLDRELKAPLLDVLFDEQRSTALIDRTAFTQPALFAVEYALTEMWRAWGVQPAAVMGHSVGEFAAACAAGVLTLEDAAHLISVRGRLMEALPDGGAMAAVFTSEAQVRDLIAPFADRVAIAAVNAQDHTVISGDAAIVARLCEQLRSRGVEWRALAVSHAFHSPLMTPMLDDFEKAAGQVSTQAPRLPLISNVTGRRMQAHERCDGAYWRAHAAQPVRFADGIRALADEGCRLFLEVGPNPALIGMGRRTVTDASAKWLPSLRKGRGEWQQVLETVASLYESSIELDWRAIEGNATRRIVSVPTYAFQRERYWIADATVGSEPAPTPDHWATDNAYSVVWQRHGAAAAEPQASPAGVWVVLVDDQGFGSAISGALRARGARCIEVRAGAETAQESADCWQVAPEQRDGFERVLSPLRGAGVTQVVDCWPLDAPPIDQATAAALEATHVKTCGAILHLSQALDLLAMPARLWVVTRDAIAVRRDERPSGVLQSTAWGFGRVVALEHPDVWGGLIDLDAAGGPEVAARLLTVIDAADGEDQVALRAGDLYVPRLTPTPSVNASPVSMHRDATYLVTGGTGNLGLRIAKEMARRGAGHLVLVSRSAQSSTAEQSAAIRDIEASGARVTVWAADVTREQDMDRLTAELPSWPPLRGVVHAAARIDPRRVKDLQLPDLLQMLRPKVAGTAALERATRDAPLDFFVMMSSTAGVFGAIASAHYAAANVFLDSFAYLRRAAGAPITSVSWGTWDVIRGTAEDLQKINRGGMKSLSTADALDAFVHLLRPSAPHVVFASVDWQTLKPLYESRRRRPFFALVGDRAAAAAPGSTIAPTPLHEQLREARPAERRGLLQAHVREIAAAVLGLRLSQAAAKKGLFDLGMDSLMSIDLRDRLEVTVGHKLPATLTFNYPSVAAIADFIAESVLRISEDDAPAAEAPLAAGPGVPDDVDELSEEELMSLLAARIEQIPS